MQFLADAFMLPESWMRSYDVAGYSAVEDGTQEKLRTVYNVSLEVID